MKSISPALSELLASGRPFFKRDLYTFRFADSTVVRTTDADIALSWNANSFASCAPACQRTRVSLKIGTEVDEMTLTVMPRPPRPDEGFAGDLLSGLLWPRAAREGYLDGAEVLVETAYLETWPTIVGVLHCFEGQVSNVMPRQSAVEMSVKSALERLARNFPRNVYQAVCMHTVYDAGCALSKGSFTATATVTGSPASTVTFIDTGLTQAAGYFDQGVLTFTTGVLAGVKRTVKSHNSTGGFTFTLPLPSIPANGVGISVFAGCDRTLETCRLKFSNAGRFKGTPFIPVPETVR